MRIHFSFHLIAKLISGFLSSIVIITSAQAVEPVSTGFFSSTAIGGTDSFAYHDSIVRKNHRAVRGSSKFSVKYLGANWYFASKESADKFSASPEKYIPNYNGFCANALSTNEGLVSTDGNVWEFFGEQLFLFYGESGRQRWLNGDWQKYKQVADAAWNTLKNK